MLFGEYSILKNGSGLAAPLQRFNGYWANSGTSEQTAIWSESLVKLALHLETLGYKEAGKQLKKEVSQGLHFQSEIPLGYGVGSSGALTAAVYDRFIARNEEAVQVNSLRKTLAAIEDFYHGNSSGLDPLISLLNKPVRIYRDGRMEILENPVSLDNIFLLDSGVPRNTDELVDAFNERAKDPLIEDELTFLINQVDECIDRYLAGQPYFAAVKKLSQWQYEHFSSMIPKKIRPLWEMGLDSDQFVLKLCGAGGGGYMTGIVNAGKKLPADVRSFPVNWL